jgi:hypothetical protein
MQFASHHTKVSIMGKQFLSILCVGLALYACVAQAATWNAITDFSSTNNPNGVWSYGWSSTLGSTFNLYSTYQGNAYGSPIWYTPNFGSLPAVFGDSANYLDLHPGPNNQYSIVRWTAPHTGFYSITATFFGPTATTTDVHVLDNGLSFFNAEITGYLNAHSLSSTSLYLSKNSTISFAVGYGTNGNYTSDTTGLSAMIVSTPIPPAAWLFGTGLLGLLRVRKKAGVTVTA